MMDIFFQDPSEIPLPPVEVRIRSLRAEPLPDRRRVHIYLELDPFQRRPNIEIVINDPEGREEARVNIVETMVRKMEFTMHIRQPNLNRLYNVLASVFYAEPATEIQGSHQEMELVNRKVVDTAQTTFNL
jgi:hypothetical protein